MTMTKRGPNKDPNSKRSIIHVLRLIRESCSVDNKRMKELARERICKHCEEKFISKRSYSKTVGNIFCSSKCCVQYHGQRRMTERLPSRERQCLGCGKTYYKNSNRARDEGNKYCSRHCSDKHHRPHKPHRLPRPRFIRRKFYIKLCEECGIEFYPQLPAAKTCSDKCASKKNAKARYLQMTKSFLCKQCKTKFRPLYGTKRRSYCSVDCSIKHSRRIGKAKRRAIIKKVRVESVDPFKVFERDEWQCKACGKLTPKSLRGTLHNDAPELDHIYPISRGGEHSYTNTQLLCRRCNGVKSDSNMNDFMTIITEHQVTGGGCES